MEDQRVSLPMQRVEIMPTFVAPPRSSSSFLPNFLDSLPSSAIQSPSPSRSPRQVEVKVDDDSELQLDSLRKVMMELKSGIVREMELAVQRELSNNFEKVIAAIRDAQPYKAREIGLDIVSNRPQIDSSLNAYLDPSFNRRLTQDVDVHDSSNITFRQADEKIAYLDPSFNKRLTQDVDVHGSSNISFRQADEKIEDQSRPCLKHGSSVQFAPKDSTITDAHTEGSVEVSFSEVPEEQVEHAEITGSIKLAHRGSTDMLLSGQDEILRLVTRGHSEMLQLSLEKKLDPNLVLHDIELKHFAKPFTHCSLLALAVLSGRESHVSLLVRMKARLDSPYGFLAGTNRQKWSGPAMTGTIVAKAGNTLSMLKLLLELKADPAAEASNGANYIWQCSYFGSHEMLQKALSFGDVSVKTLGKMADFQNLEGVKYSPLHISVFMGQEKCTRLLLDAKAPIDSKNEQNETPLDIAIQFCHPDLVTLLVGEGAEIADDKADRVSLISGSTCSSTATGGSKKKAYPMVLFRSPANLLDTGARALRVAEHDVGNASGLKRAANGRKLEFGGCVRELFAKGERNTVMVLAIALGLQTQPGQIETLDKNLILEFVLTDSLCMKAILEAMFVERRVKFRAKAAMAVKENKTAIVQKSETLKNGCVFKHKICVSSRHCFHEFDNLVKSGGVPQEGMKRLLKRLTPQKKYEIGRRLCMKRELVHVPVVIQECLVPTIHDDLRFLKGIADAPALDDIFNSPHCQAVISYSWHQVRKWAVAHFIVHIALLGFFCYSAVKRNYIGINGLQPGMPEYKEMNESMQWIACFFIPFWIFEVVMECIELAVHAEFGWLIEYLTDLQNALDCGRILMDGAIIFTAMIWGFEHTEDIFVRSFLAGASAVKWSKILFCLTPFRTIGLPVIPILFTLKSVIPSIAIMIVYFSGLAHAFIAIDVLPHPYPFAFLRAFMFGVSGDLAEIDSMNNPDNKETFEAWWLQLIVVVAAFALPITFMNIFIAAMSSSYDHFITHMEVLFQNRCVEGSFTHACVRYTLTKLWGESPEDRERRLWYCCASD